MFHDVKNKKQHKTTGVSATKQIHSELDMVLHTLIGSCFWISISHRCLGMNQRWLPDPMYRVPAIPRYYKCEGEGILEDRGHQPRLNHQKTWKLDKTLPVFWTNDILKMDHFKGKWIFESSEPTINVQQIMLVVREKNDVCFFGVADGAPIGVHEAYALNLYHFLEVSQFRQILAPSMWINTAVTQIFTDMYWKNPGPYNIQHFPMRGFSCGVSSKTLTEF